MLSGFCLCFGLILEERRGLVLSRGLSLLDMFLNQANKLGYALPMYGKQALRLRPFAFQAVSHIIIFSGLPSGLSVRHYHISDGITGTRLVLTKTRPPAK